ncbi:TetR/AcrR family transcriptional regulator [Streptomyces sp. Ru62]|uniref:TetR/AcrR family transcriptional regulator n=1 Tax=Streptomyces sp. Ru62 TaxID=2080745 RepID=UPI000CDDABF6|nr:TetR/AcrR family transcriptional regulator [Streptomyces sp. Ru62]POX58616.1 TetR/AcrR family transcriptional regulator [Streptomyces sp. Ru62]
MTEARPYHHGNLRSTLLQEAESVLAERGIEGLSLRELARAAGVSNSAPRRHFADKTALLDALAEEGYERLGRRLDEALEAAEGDFTQRLAVFARTYVEFGIEHRALLSLMHRPKTERNARLLAANDRAFAAPLRLLAEARDRGDIEPDTSGRVDMTLLTLLQGLTVLASTGMHGNLPLDALVTGCVETLMSGLRPR